MLCHHLEEGRCIKRAYLRKYIFESIVNYSMGIRIGICIPNVCAPGVVINMTNQLIGLNIPLKSITGTCQRKEKIETTTLGVISMYVI